MPEYVSCPVSQVLVNENRVRIVASFVFLTGLSYLLAPNWVIPAFLTIDFFLRGFGKSRYSPFSILSGFLVRTLSIKNKPIDQAPKLFAARLGFTMAGLLFISDLFFPLALGFCAGCHVYSLLRTPSDNT